MDNTSAITINPEDGPDGISSDLLSDISLPSILVPVQNGKGEMRWVPGGP